MYFAFKVVKTPHELNVSIFPQFESRSLSSKKCDLSITLRDKLKSIILHNN